MKKMLREALLKTALYYSIRNWLFQWRQNRHVREWELRGKPPPPPHRIKQEALRYYSRKYNLRTLVETGTYYGDMVEAMKNAFDTIYSIELSSELYMRAKKRFRFCDHIHLILGDSSNVLGHIVTSLEEPALFWLDGHYSGGDTILGESESPIRDELDHILNADALGHVMIIDDARLFGTNPAYPTLDEISQYILDKRSNVRIFIENDSIRVIPF